MTNKEIGDFGEKIARRHLRWHRYELLEANYRYKIGEIDIIARKKDVIVFVEVKTRTDYSYGTPAEAVTYTKRRRIEKMAKIYMLKYPNLSGRFDVIEVIVKIKDKKIKKQSLNHIINAFWEGM